MGLQQTSIQYKNSFYSHYYLCNYLPLSAGKDTLSHSLLKFKRGLQPDLDAWIDCSLEILGTTLILPGTTIIVRALHHNEIAAREDRPASLDQLGKALAEHFQCHYRPFLLHKSRLTREIKEFSKAQREVELMNLYYIKEPPPNPPSPAPSLASAVPEMGKNNFFIIDDILTTATTIKMIIGTILLHYPGSPLSIFTLAKADYDASLNKSTPLKGQNYHLEQGMGWLVAEETPSYYSGEQLKTWISADVWADAF